MPATARTRDPFPAPRGGTRPFARLRAFDRRVSHRLASDLTAPQVARAEGVALAEVERFLTEPQLAELVEGYRTLAAMPEGERRQILRRLAEWVLMEGLAHGDMRAALFVLREEKRGRDPADTLARGITAAAARERPTAPSSTPHPPADPADRTAWRAATHFRNAMLREHLAQRRGQAEEPADLAPASEPEQAPTPASSGVTLPPILPKPLPTSPAQTRFLGERAGGTATISVQHQPTPESTSGCSRWPAAP